MKKLTVSEYAKLKNISVQRVYQLINMGRLEVVTENKIKYVLLKESKVEIPVNIEEVEENNQDFKASQEVEELKNKLATEQREKEKLEKELYLYKINYNRVTAENKGLMEQKEGLINFNNSLQVDKEQLNKLLEQSNILQRMALEQVKQLEQVQEEKKGFFKRLFRI